MFNKNTQIEIIQPMQTAVQIDTVQIIAAIIRKHGSTRAEQQQQRQQQKIVINNEKLINQI